jgi:hypothetical protein
MRTAIDQEPTGTTNTFTAVRCECERFLSFFDQPRVNVIQEFEDGHLSNCVFNGDVFEVSLVIRTGLTPDFKMEFHYL